jgi:hypothetical protein
MTKHYQPMLPLTFVATLLFATACSAQSSAAPVGGGATHVIGHPGPATVVSAPSGLVVVLDTSALSDPSWLKALNNTSMSGVALQIHWSDIEPTQGTPDWSKLDALFAAAASSKKWVHLLIFPGFFSPSWALVGAKTEQFAIQYGPGKGTVETLPMPWDSVYLANWLAFVKLVGDRYGSSPALRLVAADGPTSVSAEFTLPSLPKDVKTWQKDGYTPSKYIGAWRKIFKAYAADFPSQYISLSEGSCLNVNDQGKIDHAEGLRCKQAIVDQANDLLGRRFALQLSDVHAGPGPHSPNSETEDQFVIGYNGKIITGFQLRTSAENNSEVMGAKGNPPLALNKSINLAMETNGAGQHVNYLEIYEPDVLATDMQTVLRYAAAIFTLHGPFIPRTLY